MAHYYVFHELGKWCRVVEAPSSFEARKVVSAVTSTPNIAHFFAIRADLMGAKDFARYEAANKA